MRTLILALAVVVAACGADTPDTIPTIPDTGDAVTQPPGEGPTQGNPTVAAAIADLAARLGVAESEITVVSHRSVTWSDGSIGCPEPGMMYTQALVEGSLTILEVDGTEYSYHAADGDRPFLCENPTAPLEGGSSDS